MKVCSKAVTRLGFSEPANGFEDRGGGIHNRPEASARAQPEAAVIHEHPLSYALVRGLGCLLGPVAEGLHRGGRGPIREQCDCATGRDRGLALRHRDRGHLTARNATNRPVGGLQLAIPDCASGRLLINRLRFIVAAVSSA